ncbi:uncharacterized protein [Asterias amurensis]|uniref:uncharacterized protein n=1 Tax=Asterias amurensis TaxID=7602 RepID=UPI003AB5A535
MGSRTKADYKKILKTFKRKLPPGGQNLAEVVVDFEKAVWSAVRRVFPHVAVKGCLFHWTQAVWRQCQALGLVVPFKSNAGVHTFIKKLMALPFLPSEHIPEAFKKLQEKTKAPDYIERTWMASNQWDPASWSAFMRSIRTNNDVEGWHHRINQKAGNHGVHFYKLIQLLHQESSLVTIQIRLVKESKLRRYQRQKYQRLQGRVFALWDQYESGRITTSSLLSACSHLNGPAI